jgi:hypothetical protein
MNDNVLWKKIDWELRRQSKIAEFVPDLMTMTLRFCFLLDSIQIVPHAIENY